MKTNHYLLPHRWQTAGWILLAVVFVVVNLLFGFDVWSVMDEAAFKLLIAGVYVIIGVSLLMIAFRKRGRRTSLSGLCAGGLLRRRPAWHLCCPSSGSA